MDNHAGGRRDGDALDVGRLLPAALGDGPHRPRVLDLVRRLRVRLDLQPPASLAKLLLLADVPGRRAIRSEAEPEHVVRVVVLLVGGAPVEGAARASVLAELVLVDLYLVYFGRISGE